MSRDPRYQRLLNSVRWRELRVSYLQAHPLCERCQVEGRVRAAVDLHHIVPVETAKTLREMEALCFNENGHNLRALCVPCHVQTHKEMGKGTKANRKEREAERLARWKDRVRTLGNRPEVPEEKLPPPV